MLEDTSLPFVHHLFYRKYLSLSLSLSFSFFLSFLFLSFFFSFFLFFFYFFFLFLFLLFLSFLFFFFSFFLLNTMLVSQSTECFWCYKTKASLREGSYSSLPGLFIHMALIPSK